MFAAEHTKSSTSIKTFCFVFASFLIVAIGVRSEPRDKTMSGSSEKSVTLKYNAVFWAHIHIFRFLIALQDKGRKLKTMCSHLNIR